MPATILVIEDDHDLRNEILDFLHRRMISVRACESIAQAEEAILQMKPDIVLSDICLPDGDGASFCMKHAGKHPQAKWLLMSGNQELVRQGNRLKNVAEAPPFAVLDKPVPLRFLHTYIQSATNKN
jgi:DNA-binding NtrC family response regulator